LVHDTDEPDDADEAPAVPLDFFLGTQRLTQLYKGNAGIIGIDDQLYHVPPVSGVCPHRAPRPSYYYEPKPPSEHSTFCTIETLGEIRPFTQAKIHELSLVLDLDAIRVERIVTFHRHGPMLYAVDESSNNIVGLVGELPEARALHQRFVFQFNLKGALELPKLDAEEGAA
jgi:hypothetical protein